MRRPSRRLNLLRRNSHAQVILGVQKHGPISRVDLARIMGLSKPCITALVDEMISEGFQIESDATVAPRGRPLRLRDINPDR